MLAEMARIDLERLRALGCHPTDEQIVRLNDLACRIESGKQTTVANMPRVAMAGNVALREPTFAALEWWHSFGRDASWTTRGKLDTYYFVLAHAADEGLFERLVSPHEIRKAVRKWKATVYATEAELWRALLYVRHADDETCGARSGIEDPKADEESLDKIYRMMIAAAGAAGVSPRNLRCETMSTLVSLLVEANQHAKIPMKTSVAREYMAYLAVYREIQGT